MAFDVLSRPYHSSGEWWLSSGQLELKCQLKCETLRFGFLINLSRESLLLDALHPKDWLFLYLHRLPSLTPLSDRCSIHGCTYVLMSAFLFSALIHKKWEIQSIVSLFSPLTGSDTVKNERARMSMHAAFAKKKNTEQDTSKNDKIVHSCSLSYEHTNKFSENLYAVSQINISSPSLVCALCCHFVCIFDCFAETAFHLHPLAFVALLTLWHFSFFKKTVRRHISHVMGCSVRWVCVSEKKRSIHVPLCYFPLLFICSNGCVYIFSFLFPLIYLLPPVSFYCLNLPSLPNRLSINLP